MSYKQQQDAVEDDWEQAADLSQQASQMHISQQQQQQQQQQQASFRPQANTFVPGSQPFYPQQYYQQGGYPSQQQTYGAQGAYPQYGQGGYGYQQQGGYGGGYGAQYGAQQTYQPQVLQRNQAPPTQIAKKPGSFFRRLALI
jgi:peptide chain release factor subunit 3